MKKAISRLFEKSFLKKSKSFKVLLLTGMRQVGKTTFLKNLAKNEGLNRNYVNLDDSEDLMLAKNDPKLFFKKYPLPIIIDEIQYAPNLFSYIKVLVDSSELRGQVWLTGSQQFHLMANIQESLAGRVGIYQMLGLSLQELEPSQDSEPFLPNVDKFLAKKDKQFDGNIFEIIWKGSYPDIALDKNLEWPDFYASYIKTYIDRDLRDIRKIEEPMRFYRFLKVVAGRTGLELNIANIAKASDISPLTAKNWLKILETSGIIYLLEPYFNNLNKRITKMPKLYFLDTGLAAYLTGWLTPNVLENGAFAGQIFETFVFTEILKSYLNAGKHTQFYFYRDIDKNEIDLLIFENNTFYPIEIKKTASPNLKDIKHFDKLNQFKEQGIDVGDGAIVCLTDKTRPLSEKIVSVPIWEI